MNVVYAAIVHDVKNQLAELALRLEARGDAQLEQSITIRAAQHLTRLLLLEYQEAGRLQVNVDFSNPADLIEDLLIEYRALFPQLHISLEIENAPEIWFYDVQLTRLALANAVHNACRHAVNQVVLRAYTESGQMTFEVANDGEGFPSEILLDDQLQPWKINQRGTGSGLYLAKKIAELHTLADRKGTIQLLNDHGAIFRLILP